MRIATALILTVLLLSGCSGSSSGSSSSDIADDEATAGSTLVNFQVTVPVYVSNALQVKIVWGEKSLTAAWVQDESWSVADTFPANTEYPLTVHFMDDNGGLVLASYEAVFKTGSSASETYRITADQFETTQWDNDNDGLSNLAESIAGTNPVGIDLTEPPQAMLELVPDKTFRISWKAVNGAQFYRVLENHDGASGFTVVSDELDASTRVFNHHVFLLKRLNARYMVQACNSSRCIDSAALHIPEAIDQAAVFFKASNTDAGDRFGSSVSLSADGNTLAVGAVAEAGASAGVNGDEHDNSFEGAHSITVGPGAGAVYVFQRSNGRWQQEAYIKSNDIGASDNFGGSLALSADGETLVVGAEYQNMKATDRYPYTNKETDIIGAAYVFARIDGTWTQQAKFKPQRHTDYDFFGKDVSVSGNGDIVTVVGRYDFHFVYERNNNEWQQKADLTTAEGDECRRGDSVTISDDGSTIVVGSNAGTAKVYVRENGNWVRQTCLRPTFQFVADGFGDIVNLSADGNILAVSAPKDEGMGSGINGSEEWSRDTDGFGAVFVFVRTNRVWQQTTYIKSDTSQTTRAFGMGMALSADAKTLVVSSGDGTHVYVHENENWKQLSLLEIGFGRWFGNELSISANGDALAGASSSNSAATGVNGYREDTSASASGAVYLY